MRGFAVLGIFAMNVVAMGMPGQAYADPTYYGGAAGANLAAWTIAYVLADGKMRALFTMLFGASLLIVTDAADGAQAADPRAPGAARTHYARMAWLLAFGMIHGWLFWYGDILVEYAIVGALLFAARRWRPGALLYAAALLFAADVARQLVDWHDLVALKRLAVAPGAPADAVRAWRGVLERVTPQPATVAREIALYRGGLADAFAARRPVILQLQSLFLPLWIGGTAAIGMLGMALYRLGFWTGGWSRAAYRGLVLAGAACLGGTALLARDIAAHDFDATRQPLADALSTLLRLPIALGYAAVLILLVDARRARWLTARLAAAGRMAFSNYLGTTLVATTIFYGYGLGLFGRLERAQLYWLVAGQWALILMWSPWWLARFRYGPFEWAWRSLARQKLQPMRRTAIASD